MDMDGAGDVAVVPHHDLAGIGGDQDAADGIIGLIGLNQHRIAGDEAAGIVAGDALDRIG